MEPIIFWVSLAALWALCDINVSSTLFLGEKHLFIKHLCFNLNIFKLQGILTDYNVGNGLYVKIENETLFIIMPTQVASLNAM